MTRIADKQRAISLRKEGKSYSEIKSILGINKSTLSGWLRDFPLSHDQMRNVRDLNPRRIERFRATMNKKREARLDVAYSKASNEIGSLSHRDLFIAGLYLYWGEGTKADRGRITITNTNPAMICAFLQWTELVGIKRMQMRVRLHLYIDMDVKKENMFWSKTLGIPLSQFRKPYIKSSSSTGLTYKTGYGHGTCSVGFESMPMWNYVTMALKYIGEKHVHR